MTRYHAAIFDLDGLLLDTERMALQASHEALNGLGFTAETGFFESFVGKDDQTVAQLVAARFGPSFGQEAFNTRWSAHFAALLEAGIPLRPFVIDMLDAVADLGLPCAIATSSRLASAERKLAITGLRPRFAALVSCDCVARPKPAPDPYLLAARRLGVDPTACIAFEDSDTGAAAAMAAGMTVVQVPDMVPSAGRNAHHLAPDLLTGGRMAGLF